MHVGKMLQVCRLTVLKSPTCTCELFIIKKRHRHLIRLEKLECIYKSGESLKLSLRKRRVIYWFIINGICPLEIAADKINLQLRYEPEKRKWYDVRKKAALNVNHVCNENAFFAMFLEMKLDIFWTIFLIGLPCVDICLNKWILCLPRLNVSEYETFLIIYSYFYAFYFKNKI